MRAEIRERPESEEATPFRVEVRDAAAREVRLRLAPAETSAASAKGVWDLQVSKGDFTGTVLAGSVKKAKQVTR